MNKPLYHRFKVVLKIQSMSSHYFFTLKRPRYFYSRWCPMGVPRDPTTFPVEFCNEICTIYVWTIKNHNFAKKKWKCCTVSKWRQNNRFLFRVISILAKIWKTTFPKECFNEIWLKVGEHEYICIAEITLKKKNYSVLKWRPKQLFDIGQ